MKKIIAVIWLLAIVSLTACESTNIAELNNLRQQLKASEAEVSELQQQLEASEAEVSELQQQLKLSESEVSRLQQQLKLSEPDGSGLENSENTADKAKATPELLDYLGKQVNSYIPTNWLEVANCKFATEEFLLPVAEKCVSYIGIGNTQELEIANALSENPESSVAVMAKLLHSSNSSVVTMAYNWISNVAHLGSSDVKDKIRNNSDIEWYLSNLIESNNPHNWLKVAKCNFVAEEDLLSIAKKSFMFTTSKELQLEIANALSENPENTVSVMAELVNSNYPNVVSIGHHWIENH